MALSQEQWYQKLRNWVPTWFFENEKYQVAYLQALAKVLSVSQQSVEDTQAETFIVQSSVPFLDLHGSERSTERLAGELDGSYKIRVQSLGNNVSRPALKRIVDSILQVGECTIVEDYEGFAFLDRAIFIDRGELLVLAEIYNAFTIIIDNQRPEAMSYFDRANFLDRGDHITSLVTPDAVFNSIVQAVNDNKAYGFLYRVIERLGT
jgi:hypothetical protein